MNQKSFGNTLLILVLISVGYFATDIYLPSLPSLQTYFQTSEKLSQMTVFIFVISFSFTPLFFGPLSDHWGRKRVILLGLSLTLIATIGCLLATTIYHLILARFFQGIGAGAVLIAARAMVPDLYKGAELARQTTYMTMLMPFILACAPTIGGYLQEGYGWKSTFVFMIAYLVLILLRVLFLQETLSKKSDVPLRKTVGKYRELFQHKTFLLYGMGIVIPSIGMFAYITASPYLFQEVLGLSPSEYGKLALFIGGTVFVASYLNSKLLHICRVNTLIHIGIGLMIASGICLLLVHAFDILNTWTLLIPSMLFFACMPFSNANSFSKALSQLDHHFGSASALLSTVQFLAGALGSLLFSLIPEVNALPLALCFFLVGIAAALSQQLAQRREIAFAKAIDT